MKYLIWNVLLAVLVVSCTTTEKKEEVHLIPQPTSLSMQGGTFELSAATQIVYEESVLKSAADYLRQSIQQQTGLSLAVKESGETKKSIFLKVKPSAGGKDSYTLEVGKEQIVLEGSNPRGVILGIQTIRQLMPQAPQGKNKVAIPAVSIADEPAWEWRGLMMDAARHFFDKEEVKRFLDMMAFYKFNKFHWHLTDDQGWRIEIKKYPLLTEKGAWRAFNNHDKSCLRLAKEESNPDYELPQEKLRGQGEDTEYGGFYTQDDIREIIAYAADRGIDVIPEIDMPGHFSAAIKVYPGLSCFGKASWGSVFSAPICPGKDATVSFCKDVLTEVFELFPFKYVHLGADEVEKDNWIKCPNCQARIRKEKLKDEKELQAWFVKEMKAYFDANGKTLIGWDEIIEGGLAEGATVMWWRTWAKDAVQTATAKGSEVILAPNSHNYFDYKQDYSTLRKLYEFDPVPAGLSGAQKRLIKGVQANLWAETIPSFQRLEFMLYPRMLALSEVAWKGDNRGKWGDFYTRLIQHFPRLDVMGVNYRPLDFVGLHATNAFVNSTEVVWDHPLPGISIYYTTDGSVPTQYSNLYTSPFTISETTDFTLRFFRPDGSAADLQKILYRKESYRPGENIGNLQPGLTCTWHEAIVNKSHEIDNIPVKQTYVVKDISVPEGVGGKRGLIYSGYLKIDKEGIYTFTLGSDDGSLLYIGDEVIVDNDGPHGPVTLSGQKALSVGYHPVKLYYFDMNNGGFIDLKLQDADGNDLALSADRLGYVR